MSWAARGWSGLCVTCAILATGAAGRERQGAELVNLDEVPLRTHGRWIVNNKGERVKWACVNWYGAYSTNHAVGGLEVQPMQVIVDRIKAVGFNCVRMMYSTQAWKHNPQVLNSTLAANPQLHGMRWQEIFDITMKAVTDAGLMVILNNHNSKSGWCCHYTQDEGLWYVPEYPEQDWMDSLTDLTERYRNNSMVVAIDLRNEVHDYEDTHLTWGDGNLKTDWASAATRAGNAVLQKNPDVLIVVMAMCFGLDLRPMKKAPIQLTLPNKVVYQTHNYLEYQVFDNVSKMLLPWHEIRNWTLVFWAICLLIFCLLWRTWVVTGRSKPPSGCVHLSVGIWLMICSIIGAWMSGSFYNFGMKFCAIAMDTDILPWLISFVILSVLFGLQAFFGAWKLGLPQLVVRSRSGDYEADAGSGPTSTRPALMCCHRGYKSVARAKRCHTQDVLSLVSRARGREPEFPSKENMDRNQPAEWDVGSACGLQCFVAVILLMTVGAFLYIWSHILPTYWWMERHLDGLWGFALEEGTEYTAPVWMGEFGQEVRGQYWLNFVRYLSIRDVDFGYWAMNGIKYAEGEIDGSSGAFINYETPKWVNETFGILSHDYVTIRHPWKLLDLQGLMDSPARWTPDTAPCSREVHPSCGAR